MRNFSRDNREDRQMFRATCEDCGRSCEVPFRPTGGKPVYCSNCFKKDDNGPRREDRRDDRREDRGRDRGKPTMFRATCEDCGRSCEVPFRPSGDKPVYCSNCFTKGNSSGPSKSDQSGRKFEEINAKLDQILSLLRKGGSGRESAVALEDDMEDAPLKKKVKRVIKKISLKKAVVKKPAKKILKKKSK